MSHTSIPLLAFLLHLQQLVKITTQKCRSTPRFKFNYTSRTLPFPTPHHHTQRSIVIIRKKRTKTWAFSQERYLWKLKITKGEKSKGSRGTLQPLKHVITASTEYSTTASTITKELTPRPTYSAPFAQCNTSYFEQNITWHAKRQGKNQSQKTMRIYDLDIKEVWNYLTEN